MHDDYFAVGRTSPERESNAWRGYDGAGPAKVAMLLLAGHLLMQLVSLGGRTVAPSFFYGAAVSTVMTFYVLGMMVSTAIAFLTWFFRAYRTTNLAVGTTHDPGQAVWSFVIPILNLFRPYQIATEIWRKSGDGTVMHHNPLLIVWWGLWVVFGAGPVFVVFFGLHRGAGGLANPTSIVSLLASVALTCCAIAVVRTLDARIRAKAGAEQQPATF